MKPKDGITAFNGIFEQRLTKLVKDIKKIRKDPASKDKLKRLISEGRDLKNAVKKDRKASPISHRIIIPMYDINSEGWVGQVYASPNVTVTSIHKSDMGDGEGQEIILDFEIKK